MTGWLFLSDRDLPVADPLPDVLDSGTLVLELSWPLPTGELLDWQGQDNRALSLFHHPSSGLGLLWRDGPVLRRFLLAGALRSDARLARLHLRWSAAESAWSMRLDGADETTIGSTYGLAPPALPAPALAQLCAGKGLRRRDASVLWFGVTSGAMPPKGTAWMGLSTPVPTVEGPVPAGRLQPGQWVLTRDAGPVRLRMWPALLATGAMWAAITLPTALMPGPMPACFSQPAATAAKSGCSDSRLASGGASVVVINVYSGPPIRGPNRACACCASASAARFSLWYSVGCASMNG